MSETIFAAASFRVRSLRAEADSAAVDDLGQRCADYAFMLTGEPPKRNGSAEFFAAVADGKNPGDMLKLGVVDSAGRLIGLLDVARDHPALGIWYIGLLLIDPVARGQGAGAAVVRGLKKEAARNGASSIMLSVVAGNERALKFWMAQGFAVTKELAAKRFGRKDHVRFELAADVCS